MFINKSYLVFGFQTKFYRDFRSLNLFGVFIYNDVGSLISMSANNTNSSSVYQGHSADKAIKIVSENSSRNINQAIGGANLLSKYPGWNNWNTNGTYCSSTNNDRKAATGGDWWEYKFPDVVNITAIEIYGRADCCPERFQNMLIQIFNDAPSANNDVNNDVVWDGNTGTDPNPTATQLFVIEKNGVIHHS